MAFDPDAYLAKKSAVQTGGFDPDAYLASKSGAMAAPQQATQQPPPAAEPSFFDQLRQSYGNQVQDAWNTISQNPGAAAMETVGAINRAAMAIPDMPINLINAISRANEQHGIGSGGQLPTITDTMTRAFGIGGDGYLPEGAGRNAAQAAGNFIVGAAGVVPVARVAGAPSSMAADFAGIGSTQTPFLPGLPAPFTPDLPYVSTAPISEQQKQLQNLSAGIPDANTARVMVSPVTGKVITDPVGKAAVKQGFPDAMVASIKTMTPDTRRRAAEMLDISEKSLTNETYRDHNNVLQVVGDSILDRVKVVYNANKVAGRTLGQLVKTIKNEPVDVRPPLENFVNSLNEMGIGIERTFDPKSGEPVFSILDRGSTIQGLDKATGPLKHFVTRVFQDPINTVQDAHRLKGFFDNILHYGKTPEGIPPALYNTMKKLRAEVNGVIGEQYPKYAQVNKSYSETIDALEGIQDLAGKRVDLMGDNADNALGVLARRVISNAQSNYPLRNALTELDTTARKYITPGQDIVPYKPVERLSGVTPQKLDNDDLVRLVGYASDLMGMLGTAPKNSMEGILEKGVKLGAGGKAEVARQAIDAVQNKLAGRNQAAAIKAMRELLQRGQ